MGPEIRVLYVGSDPDVAAATATRLTAADGRLDVETVGTPQAGLERVAAGGVDCVVADDGVPGTDGLGFLATTRADYPDLPFVLLVEEGADAVASKAISRGATDYFERRDGVAQYELLANRITNCVDRSDATSDRGRERAETILQALGDPIYALDADGHCTFINDALTEELGYERSELLGAHVSEILPPGDVERGRERIVELLEAEDRRQTTHELTAVAADGSDGAWESHISLLPFDEDGSFQGTVGVLRDISTRKRREEALNGLQAATQEFIQAPDAEAVAERAVETARVALDQPINAVWLYDEASDALEPAAATAAGRELVPDLPVYAGGDSLSWAAFESGEIRVYDDVRRATDRRNEDTPIRSEIILPLGDHGVMNLGSTEVAEFSDIDVSLAQLFGNTVEAALSRAKREAERRAQQRELQRQNERLDNFASVVSHDLQNPLQVACTYLELAQSECDCEYLDDVAQAHSRMAALVDDLLTLARQGRQVTDPEAVALGRVVEDCWRSVTTAGAELVLETDRTVRADEGRLRRLFENLVSNAVEHGAPEQSDGDDTGATVTVTVGDLPDGDGFYVADDGPGIPPDERDDVFEYGHSTSEDGTGFGLAIVQETAEAHGWDVRVTESADGGARFEVTGVDCPNPEP